MAISSYLGAPLAMLAATYLAHSTLLIGGAWLAVKLFRIRSHALAERMWKLAGVLGLATAPLQIGVGFSRPMAEFVLEAPPGAPFVSYSGDPHAGGTFRTASSPPAAWRVFDGDVPLLSTNAPAAEMQASTALHSAVESPRPTALIPGTRAYVPRGAATREQAEVTMGAQYAGPIGLALAAWFAAAAAWLVAQAWWFGRFLLRARALSSGPALNALDWLRRRTNMRQEVRLLVSTECMTPLACGARRWTIILPAGAEESLQRDELAGLLAHELAHLVRGDLVWLWMGRILTACLAFQPLNRLAYRRWQRAAEYLCDDWAAERLTDPLALARCLTQIAGWRRNRLLAAAAVAASGDANMLVSRVERLIGGLQTGDRWSTAGRQRLLAAAAALLTGVFIFCGPRAVCCSPSAAVPAQAPLHEAPKGPQERSKDRAVLWPAWNGLQTDLRRVDVLLAPFTQDPAISDIARRIRDRAAAIERRLDEH
jgi:Zn-dependent protease with chaperone function